MDAGRRRCAGGILTLLRLIDRHAAAFEYDFRHRFGLPLRSVFTGEMSWREAYGLAAELARDPSSHVAAAVSEWAHPWPREAFVLADVYDLLVAVNADPKRRRMIKPYPRPQGNPDARRSRRPTVSQDTIRAALAARGHRPVEA